MCVVFWSLRHPDYSLILCSNRDEFLSRPTLPAQFHGFGSETDQVLSGRDVRAGGTWLGINKSGRVTVLYAIFDHPALQFKFKSNDRTNITEPARRFAQSRGELTSSFLLPKSDVGPTFEGHLADITSSSKRFAGFNLLLFSPIKERGSDDSHQWSYDAAWVTNSGANGKITSRPLSPKEKHVGGASNGIDGVDASDWPKVVDGCSLLEQVLTDSSAVDISGNASQDREAWLVSKLFNLLAYEHHDAPLTREDLRKTIRAPPVSLNTKGFHGPSDHEDHADTDVPPANSIDVAVSPWYGTRLSTVILIRRSGEVLFIERDIFTLSESGMPFNASKSFTGERSDAKQEPTKTFSGTDARQDVLGELRVTSDTDRVFRFALD